MEPLRIEFKLVSEWCPPSLGVHLDGLVAHTVVREAIRTEGLHEQANSPVYAELISDLPFEKYESENGWCWKASKLQVVGYRCQERRYLTAKTPVDEMATAIGDGIVDSAGGSVIDTQRGIAKNSSMFYTVEYAKGLTAWCIGDKDALEYLLQEIDAIGVKTRLGHGLLAPFEDGRLFRVTNDDDAIEKWKARNSPERLQQSMFPGIGAIHTPYWRNKEYCWMPCQE
jgi:CRISPR type IV-associated protein Csf3